MNIGHNFAASGMEESRCEVCPLSRMRAGAAVRFDRPACFWSFMLQLLFAMGVVARCMGAPRGGIVHRRRTPLRSRPAPVRGR